MVEETDRLISSRRRFAYLAVAEHHFDSTPEDTRLRNEIFDGMPRRDSAGPRASRQLLRVYTDLEAPEAAPIHAQGMAHSLNELLSDSPETVPFQNNTPSFLRRVLAREALAEGVDVESPHMVVKSNSSPNWIVLLGWLDGWDDAHEVHRIRVARLVNRLGFYRFNYQFLTEPRQRRVGDPLLRSELVSLRAVAAFKCGASLPDVEHLLAASAEMGCSAPATRAAAEIYLAVHHAKISKNQNELTRWSARAKQSYLEYVERSGGGEDSLFRSIFFRGFAYVPFIQKDGAKASSMLDEAESAAHEALASPFVNRIAAQENLFAVTETRIQEARALGQRDLAIRRSRELVQLDALDPRSHIHLGETLVEDSKFESALDAFMCAASIGAPYTPRALSLAGDCLERMGREREALECYVSALDIEPCAALTLLRAYHLATHLEFNELRSWSARKLNALRRKVRA